MPSPSTTPPALTATAAIRAGVALLGATGFVLSYDALRQMAAAIHVREPLTYAFPLVIDGFIAIGVGALLLLRTAPLRSRLYVWTLVITATATSIWANALHAIRLNQQHRHTGLHLGNPTVGALSAIAPLALAGAVHLYLVIRRHPTPVPASPTAHLTTAIRHDQATAPPRKLTPETDAGGRHQPTPHPNGHVAESIADKAEAQGMPGKPKGRKPSAPMDEILAIGRTAPRGRDGRISRRAVETAIRTHGHAIGKDRLAEATRLLQDELDRTHPGSA
ncbi:DUF2637 domain-containing protein [Streptomyces sp. B1866]|uniref:DUF2637 domain-containing protein n=1 Tax=Streptomyces sp. B1866 TaxID=3075431 RepID=UPI00288ED9BE|nr:DUF2637 domain-containing protein [Streptomyces sp. B1866]MDT3395800.1 DUF2637 domain-containing protein [Streptomyces sp. B1866]